MQLKGYKKRQTDLDDTLQLIKPSVLITNLLHNVLKFSGDLRCSSLLGVIYMKGLYMKGFTFLMNILQNCSKASHKLTVIFLHYLEQKPFLC